MCDVEMRDKYPLASDFIESVIDIICEAFPLKVYGPPHDVAGAILTEFFVEDNNTGGITHGKNEGDPGD